MKVFLNNPPKNFSKVIKNLGQFASDFLGQPEKLSVCVTFVNADEIHELNKTYREVDRATDVLSFPTIDNVGHGVIDVSLYPYETDFKTGLLNIGDIFICLDVAKSQAEEYGHSLKREVAFLFLHGLLHLLGFDHIEPADEEEMSKTANEILSACSIER